jgi:hypothetical protein
MEFGHPPVRRRINSNIPAAHCCFQAHAQALQGSPKTNDPSPRPSPSTGGAAATPDARMHTAPTASASGGACQLGTGRHWQTAPHLCGESWPLSNAGIQCRGRNVQPQRLWLGTPVTPGQTPGRPRRLGPWPLTRATVRDPSGPPAFNLNSLSRPPPAEALSLRPAAAGPTVAASPRRPAPPCAAAPAPLLRRRRRRQALTTSFRPGREALRSWPRLRPV